MKKTAKEVYEKTVSDNKNLLKMIGEVLEKRAKKAEHEGIHWGHVGDLQHTKSQLMETLASYLYTPEGTEKEVHDAIESELEKMRNEKDVDGKIYIPDNSNGIKEGYYEMNGIVDLLRKHKNKPEKIQFIADMLEE